MARNGVILLAPHQIQGHPRFGCDGNGILRLGRSSDTNRRRPLDVSDPRDPREQMIAQTSAFLSWALREGSDEPRIPRRRLDQGGFTKLLRAPGARAAVAHWWSRVLDRVA